MTKYHLDLSGPSGTSFRILAATNYLRRQEGDDPAKDTFNRIAGKDILIKHMTSGDFNHLVRVFSERFPYVKITSKHKIDGIDSDLYTIGEREIHYL
jgi:hypothetical protein